MGLTRQQLEDLYYYLLLTRRTEERMRKAFKEGQKDPAQRVIAGNLYLSTYQEAVSVGAAFAAEATDWISHTHRDPGALLARDRWSLTEVFSNVLGRAEGPARGRDSGLNFGSIEKRTLPKHIFMGIALPIACGIAHALKQHRSKDVVVAFFGDGATSQGYFHEAMNDSGLNKLPNVWVCNNNGWAISTPAEKQIAGGWLDKRAETYGMPGIYVDGGNILAVYEKVKTAIERAKAGEGPTFIEAQTFRLSGHAEHDDPLAYMPATLWEEMQKQKHDPLWRYRQYLLKNKIMEEADFAAHEEDVANEIEKAWAQALAMPLPDPRTEQEIFAVSEPIPRPTKTTTSIGRKGRYDRAINEALADAMRADPNVLLLGQDVGYGGVFGVAQKLYREFGPERVVDTPLSENLILGRAIGLAYLGYRPVAEIQFADFVAVSFAMLTQFAAQHYWRSGIPLPIVVRLPYGIKGAGGPSHSQSPESWFLNVPGLKMVFPSTASDAYGLLRTAIADPDPVLFFEHKGLYQAKEAIGPFAAPGEEDEFIPIGRAALKREGKDCLLVSYGRMVHLCLEAAEILAKEKVGVDCSVLDLRTLVPLDREQLTKLAQEIGKVVIVHEAPISWGPAGEIAQVIREADQRISVERIGAKDAPIPSSPPLEKNYLPNTADIIHCVKQSMLKER